MKKKILIGILLMTIIPFVLYSQDRRLLETKVADLLAQMPAGDNGYADKLMSDMLMLGSDGLRKICDGIVPSGSGDDTKPRYAVESFSRYIIKNGTVDDKALWEKICISYAINSKDNGVKDFFIKQLQISGGNQAAEAMKAFLSDKENCTPAIAAISAVGGKTAENILSESLKDHTLPCSAAVMNALAAMKSAQAVKEFVAFASDDEINTRSAALNALAQSGSPEAYPVLLKAARDFQFRWERTGATAALLNYAKNVAVKGDLKTMDKICKLVMSKCNDKPSMQNKSAALKTLVTFHGIDALPEIFKGAASPDFKFRNDAINMTSLINGDDVVKRWMEFFMKAKPEAKPEIIRMLGSRGSKTAVPLIITGLSDGDMSVRNEAAAALAELLGKEAAPSLVNYIVSFDSSQDQDAAAAAWKTIAGNDETELLKPALSAKSAAARKTAIVLIAWNRNSSNFSDILKMTSSDESGIRQAALKALPDLSGPENQEALLSLLASASEKEDIAMIQDALSAAASKTADASKRSSVILKTFNTRIPASKLIPVLGKTGGREALSIILKEFISGSPDTRELCFNALTTWPDYTASSALYEICASGNKVYKDKAFSGYVEQVNDASIPDEEKFLLFRKIMPYAGSSQDKTQLLTEIGKLKTYNALFFTGSYLEDPDLSGVAAKAAMNIALPSAGSRAGMYGKLVREILTGAQPKLTGSEKDYDREMIEKYLASMPRDEGFVSIFDGRTLDGWQGLVQNPVARSKMKPAKLAEEQAKADKKVPLNWTVKDGCIIFNGQGDNLCSKKDYGDFEMLVDWKISKKGDSGIYLRGTPQVQIWDTSRTEVGAQVGSGGLYNNQKNQSKPLLVADNPVGEWNTFRILMTGEKVSVWLNGILVVDNVTFENYWDASQAIFPKGPVELQAHGTDLQFRDIYIREVSEKDFNLTPDEKTDGFVSLFNGRNLDNWTGDKTAYSAENGMIVVKPVEGSAGNLYTEKEYADFIFRFEFQLTPAANNGIGIRAPLTGDAAYVGMEIQVLDNTAPVYSSLHQYQYHGSVYGVIPARREFLKPVGEWNSEEIMAKGSHIKVTLNGTVIVDGDIAGPRDNGTMDHNEHPGLKNATGHIGFLGHGSVVKFRNIRIKDLSGN
jgi:HEAT repeat protein